MHLVSLQAQTIQLGDSSFPLRAGESIHTENSYKFGVEPFGRLARASGFAPRATWTDKDGLFAVHALEVL